MMTTTVMKLMMMMMIMATVERECSVVCLTAAAASGTYTVMVSVRKRTGQPAYGTVCCVCASLNTVIRANGVLIIIPIITESE